MQALPKPSLALLIYGLKVPDETHSKTLGLLSRHFGKINLVRVSTDLIETENINNLRIEDPGPVFGEDASGMNFNRVLIQLQKGSDILEGEYMLVMRADLQLINDRFIYGQKRRIKAPGLLSQRIVTTSVYFRSRHFSKGFRRSIPASFHPSDWIWFGLRSDVMKLFSDLVPEKSLQNKSTYCLNRHSDRYLNLYSFRFPTEMYFGLNLAEEKFRHCYLDYNSHDRSRWLKFSYENLVILPARKFGFKKITPGHQKSIYFAFLEPTMIFATVNSKRLFALMLFRKIFPF
jgi:hypothetical protein